MTLPVAAQPWVEYEPCVGREPARSHLIPMSSQDSQAPNSYLRTIEWERVDELTYRAKCNVPFAWANRQIFLRVESAPMGYTLSVNDKEVAGVATGALAAEFNLTKSLVEGANTLCLTLDADNKLRRLDDFTLSQTIGESELISQPTIRIRDVSVSTRKVEERYIADVTLDIKSDALNRKQATLHYELIAPDATIKRRGTSDVNLEMRGSAQVQFSVEIPEKDLWSLDSPTFHRLKLRTQILGRFAENFEIYVGFRTVELSDGKLLLNGVEVPLKSYVVERELSYADIEEIKYGKGCNTLYPLPGQSCERLYRMADEMGMLVVAQTPLCSEKSGGERTIGGNPVNDPRFRLACIDRALSTYGIAHRYPSVIGFTIGYNSSNGIGLYESFLRLRSKIQDHRPIYYGGADGEWNSEDLELNIAK